MPISKKRCIQNGLHSLANKDSGASQKNTFAEKYGNFNLRD
jgi:hypothetical protein